MRNLARGLCALLLVCVAVGAARGAGSPGKQVDGATTVIVSILKDPALKREEKWARISEIINERFDFESMSRSVLGTTWRKATKEERRQFVKFFTNYLEEVYRTKIESYTDQEIEVRKEYVDGKRAIVDTVILSGAIEIPVRYKMRLNEGDWRVYDVVIEGVSMVSNYRNTFNAIAQTGGMQGLLNDVQRRIDRHKRAKAAAN